MRRPAAGADLVDRAAAVHVEHIGRPRAPDPDVPELASAPEQHDAAAAEARPGAAARSVEGQQARARRALSGVEIARPRREHHPAGHVHRVRARVERRDRPRTGVDHADAEGDRPVRQTPARAGPVIAGHRDAAVARPGRVPPPHRDVALRGAGAERVVGDGPRRDLDLGDEQPPGGHDVQAATAGIDRHCRRQHLAGPLGVVGARLDPVDGNGPDAPARVQDQDPDRADALLRAQHHGSAARNRERVHGPAGERAPGQDLAAPRVHPQEALAARALARDRHQAVRAHPADREPRMPADPRHAQRAPAGDVHEVDARAALAAAAERVRAVRERQPAPIR